MLEQLLNRVSVPAKLLHEPAPRGHELQQILQAAVSVPDHGELRPWRFLIIDGDARAQLGDIFVSAAQQLEPDMAAHKLEDIRSKPIRSPLIIAVIARLRDDPKIPQHEQLLSAGLSAYNILLAANALNYHGIWVTGPLATHAHTLQALGLTPTETVVGFIYLGTPSVEDLAKTKVKLKHRPNAADYTEHWTG
ncbi:MAG: nitroreductase [Gammaproteobacteria bacterium]|nr:nitroreductase [Gammaproteobacteria bacterium]